MSLSIYPIGTYITTTVRDMCFGAEPLTVLLVRDALMHCFKQGEGKVLSPKFFGKDRNASEQQVVDAMDCAERNQVLDIRYEKNAKGYDVMIIQPTAKVTSKLLAAKEEAQARFAR